MYAAEYNFSDVTILTITKRLNMLPAAAAATKYASAHIQNISQDCNELNGKARPLDISIENRTQFAIQRVAGDYFDSGKIFGGNYSNIGPLQKGNLAAANGNGTFMQGVSGAITFSIVVPETGEKVYDFVLGFSNPFAGSAKLRASFSESLGEVWDNMGSTSSKCTLLLNNGQKIEITSFPGSPQASLSIIQRPQ